MSNLTLLRALGLMISAAAMPVFAESTSFDDLFSEYQADNDEGSADGEPDAETGGSSGESESASAESSDEEKTVSAPNADDSTAESKKAERISFEPEAITLEDADTIELAAPEKAAIAPPARLTRAIEEIVVTATKREVSLRDVPATISAITGENLEQMGAQGQDDFLKLNPGVTLFDDGWVARQITVRGIAADVATNGTTGILMGDVPFNDAVTVWVTADPNPFDLARIEVLKGPQGTLFGAAGLNGAVRYIPQEPVLGAWEGKAFAQMESVERGDIGLIMGAAVNLPVFDRDDLAVRVVALDRSSAGWIDELQRGETDVNEKKQTAGRILGLWQPSDRLEVSMMAMTQESELSDYPFSDNTEGRLSRSNTPIPSPSYTKYDLQTVGFEYGFENFDFFSQTSHITKQYEGEHDLSRIAGDRPPQNLRTVVEDYSDGIAQEFRLGSNEYFGGNWTWLGGVFFRQIDQTLLTDVLNGNEDTTSLPTSDISGLVPGAGDFSNDNGEPYVAHSVVDIDVREMALFGEVTMSLGHSLDVTLGLRAYRTLLDGVSWASGALTAGDAVQQGGTESRRDASIDEKGLNPKLVLNYFFNDDISLYLSASRGFRFGGMNFLGSNATTEVPDTYNSDTLWSYEMGLRTKWLGGALTADLTPFYVDWIDPQVYQNDNTANTVNWRENVGGVRSYGVELAVQYLPPIEGVSLSFGGAFVKAETTEAFTTNAGTLAEPGTPWPQTAEWQTATTLSYQRDLPGGWSGGASLVHAFVSEAWSNLDQYAKIFGYQTLDLQLNISNVGLSWLPQLSLNVSNLTDKRGLVGAAVSRSELIDRTYMRPRTVVLRMGMEF